MDRLESDGLIFNFEVRGQNRWLANGDRALSIEIRYVLNIFPAFPIFPFPPWILGAQFDNVKSQRTILPFFKM